MGGGDHDAVQREHPELRRRGNQAFELRPAADEKGDHIDEDERGEVGEASEALRRSARHEAESMELEAGERAAGKEAGREDGALERVAEPEDELLDALARQGVEPAGYSVVVGRADAGGEAADGRGPPLQGADVGLGEDARGEPDVEVGEGLPAAAPIAERREVQTNCSKGSRAKMTSSISSGSGGLLSSISGGGDTRSSRSATGASSSTCRPLLEEELAPAIFLRRKLACPDYRVVFGARYVSERVYTVQCLMKCFYGVFCPPEWIQDECWKNGPAPSGVVV